MNIMENLGQIALLSLLENSNRFDAGRRKRYPAVQSSRLGAYLDSRNLSDKEAFEHYMQAAQSVGAIKLVFGEKGKAENFIQRINLVDPQALAVFLGVQTMESVLEQAQALLGPHLLQYPVLNDVLAAWEKLNTVRSYKAIDAQDWVDAIRAIEYAEKNRAPDGISAPVKELSARLFHDSKRITKLVAPIDVLLSGDITADARPKDEVWDAIGLFREELPVRMAGNCTVRRSRVTSVLDAPYSGFPAITILGLGGIPDMVMSIENQTTFHSEAKRRCDENVLLIYSAGQPNSPWHEMYARILADVPLGTPIYHWGDIDEGGFRIAAKLAQTARSAGHVLQAWKMDPKDVPRAKRRPANDTTIQKMSYFAKAAGWPDLAVSIEAERITVEQESQD